MIDSNVPCVYNIVISMRYDVKIIRSNIMRAELYSDGIKRINAKVVVPMDVSDVADYILSAVVGESVTLNEVRSLNKRQLLGVAKGEVETFGVHKPKKMMRNADPVTENQVRTYVYDMFPELH